MAFIAVGTLNANRNRVYKRADGSYFIFDKKRHQQKIAGWRWKKDNGTEMRGDRPLAGAAKKIQKKPAKRPKPRSKSDSDSEDEEALPWGEGEGAGRTKCKVMQTAMSTESLMKLKDVVYVGFDASNDHKRAKSHFKNANMYGNNAVLHAYISRYSELAGKHEGDVTKFYLSNKRKTWQGRGLSNWNEQKQQRKAGHVYVIVRAGN